MAEWRAFHANVVEGRQPKTPGRPPQGPGAVPRDGGELAFHVLDAMHAVLESASTGRCVELTSSCERPAPLPEGLGQHELDA